MTEREKVIGEAKTWLGTPYHHQAKIKGAGVDCAQFILVSFRDAGLMDDVDFGQYTRDWYFHRDNDLYLDYMRQYFIEIPKDKLLPGDVICFKYGRTVSHSGIYIGDNKIIHSYTGHGVIYSSLNEAEFIKRFHSVWRWKTWADCS